MLKVIHDSLEELLTFRNPSLSGMDRINLFRSAINNDTFTRKDYLRNYKEISPATANRDLRMGVEKRMLKKTGAKRNTTYRFSPIKADE